MQQFSSYGWDGYFSSMGFEFPSESHRTDPLNEGPTLFLLFLCCTCCIHGGTGKMTPGILARAIVPNGVHG
jgi:hypothetical protein